MAGLTTKALTINGGVGNDTITFSGSGSLGALNLTLGAGSNSASFTGLIGSFTASAFNFTSTSSMAETDTLTLARVQVLGKFDARFGAGASALQIDNSSIGSLFTVDTASGADTVNLDTLDAGTGVVLAKAATLTLGEGDDLLVLGGPGTGQLLTAKSTFKADAGPGTNTLTNAMTNIFAKTPVFTSFA